ncbi:MAG: HNH endonuclease, partial [Acidobacteriota bacterium]
PVNGRDPTGQCLGLDKAGLPCSYYAKKLPGFLVESMGINQIPRTGVKKLDSAMRTGTEAPLRLSVLPVQGLLSTGDSSGEYLYRIERSTFHGEMPIDPGNADDQLLMLGVMGDVATFIAPAGSLEGDFSTAEARKAWKSFTDPSRAGQEGVIVIRLPRSQGSWIGEVGNSGWVSEIPEINAITGGKAVPFRNNFPDFSEWAVDRVLLSKLVSHTADFAEADRLYAASRGWLKASGEANAAMAARHRVENRLTWHHVEDKTTMQLVPASLNRVPHLGGNALSKK